MSDSKMIIFLDIDGVLHPISNGVQLVDSCIQSLVEAIEELDVEIVIASTWRENYEITELRKLLSRINKPIIDVTPVIDDPFVHHVRYREVIQYLEGIGQPGRAWVAIDDTRGFYPPSAPVFWTDPRAGFTQYDILRFKEFVRDICERRMRARSDTSAHQ